MSLNNHEINIMCEGKGHPTTFLCRHRGRWGHSSYPLATRHYKVSGQNDAPAALHPRKTRYPLQKKLGWDGHGKSRLHRDAIPEPSTPQPVHIPIIPIWPPHMMCTTQAELSEIHVRLRTHIGDVTQTVLHRLSRFSWDSPENALKIPRSETGFSCPATSQTNLFFIKSKRQP